MKDTKYVSIHVTPAARDALRRSTLRASGEAGYPITMSERLITALAEADTLEAAARAEGEK